MNASRENRSFALPLAALAWFGIILQPGVVAGIAANIAFVGLSYHFLLRNTWNPQGAQLLADVLMHYAVPAFYVLYWWRGAAKSAPLYRRRAHRLRAHPAVRVGAFGRIHRSGTYHGRARQGTATDAQVGSWKFPRSPLKG